MFLLLAEYTNEDYTETVGVSASETSAISYCNLNNKIAKDESIGAFFYHQEVNEI